MLTPVSLPLPPPAEAAPAPAAPPQPANDRDAPSFETVLASAGANRPAKPDAGHGKNKTESADHDSDGKDKKQSSGVIPGVANTATRVMPAAKPTGPTTSGVEPVHSEKAPQPQGVVARTPVKPEAPGQDEKKSANEPESIEVTTVPVPKNDALTAEPPVSKTAASIKPQQSPRDLAQPAQQAAAQKQAAVASELGNTFAAPSAKFSAIDDQPRSERSDSLQSPTATPALTDAIWVDRARVSDSSSSTKVDSPRTVTWDEAVRQVTNDARIELQRSGKAEFEFRVSPPDLGLIRIRLMAASSGVTADLRVSSAAVQHLVENKLPELRERLVAAGVAVQGFNVSHGGGSPQQSRQSAPTPWSNDFSDRQSPRQAQRRTSTALVGAVDVTA
jgi:flagellar hook-length control protein FliK